MKKTIYLLLFSTWAWARPTTFSDGQCRVVFPLAYRSLAQEVVAQERDVRFRLTRTRLKLLDPAQHLANLRRAHRARGATVQLIRKEGMDGLEIRRAHFLARVFVSGQTAYQAEVTFPGREPGSAVTYVRSLGFLKGPASAYVPQRMARYDALVREVPVQKCAENLLEISSLLTGFKIAHKKYPSALSSLGHPVTAAYGYRRTGTHYLLYCSGHHHPGLPPHYPRSDDALRTMLTPTKIYRPGY
jgi:hypothetical protein